MSQQLYVLKGYVKQLSWFQRLFFPARFLEQLTRGCSLMKLKVDPTMGSFEEIDRFLSLENSIILFNDALYYADRHAKTVTKIEVTVDNQIYYDALKSRFKTDYKMANARDQDLITRLTQKIHPVFNEFETLQTAFSTVWFFHLWMFSGLKQFFMSFLASNPEPQPVPERVEDNAVSLEVNGKNAVYDRAMSFASPFPELFQLNMSFLLQTPLFKTMQDLEQNLHYLALYSDLFSMRQFFYEIPPFLITRDRWIKILEICQEHRTSPSAGERALNIYIETIRMHAQLPLQTDINANKITDTYDVNLCKSVSDSAVKLRKSYGHRLNTLNLKNALYGSLKKGMNTLYLETGISELLDIDYIDPTTGISLVHLLELIWMAVNDSERLINISSSEEAIAILHEAILEIYWGNPAESDRVPLCPHGAFNKLLEKCHDIHPDIQIVFIMDATAALKLPLIIREEVNQYLLQLKSKITSIPADQAFKNLLKDIDSDGVAVIWVHIQAQVEERFYTEFSPLFESRTDSKFTGFMAAALDISQPISLFLKSQNVSDLSQFSMFATRNQKTNHQQMIEIKSTMH